MKKSKKLLLFLVSVATAIGIAAGDQYGDAWLGNVAHAAGPISPDKRESQLKADIAYELAEITARVVSSPTIEPEKFKVELAYANTLVTARVLALTASSKYADLTYEMTTITTAMISDPKLNISQAKLRFSTSMTQLTAKILNDGVNPAKAQQVPAKENQAGTQGSNAVLLQTYNNLVNELAHIGDRRDRVDRTVKIDGELRYHYALNTSSVPGSSDSSGLRLRAGFDTALTKDWRIRAMVEGKKGFVNYRDSLKLERLYAIGRIGGIGVHAGRFGYLMGEGNLYDSGFTGIRLETGDPVKYTLSYGETDYTTKTAAVTAKYKDFDYDLEAGLYSYQQTGNGQQRNTIWQLGGNYHFSNFSAGAMVLRSTLVDSHGNRNGYVFSLSHGKLKSYRPGTYTIFVKYYNQPQGTYIAHGMNGLANRLQGFSGYGAGMHYTLAKNVMAGLEYYNLTDKISGEAGNTWWVFVTNYF